MTALRYITVVALVISLALPVRAELTVKQGTKNETNVPVVVVTPKKKEKKPRDPMRLLRAPRLRWVDIGKYGDKNGEGQEGDGGLTDLSDLGAKMFGEGKDKGNGGAVARGKGTGSGTFFDESAKKNGAKVDPGVGDGDRKGPPKGPPGGPPQNGAVIPTFWIPICFFFDTAKDKNEMNSIIKTVVDNFGKCDVAVRPLPYMIQPGSYQPHEPEPMNNFAQTKCNANQAFGVEGSAAQTHPNSLVAADKMCDKNWVNKQDKTSTGGCSGVGNKSKGSIASSFTDKTGQGYGSFGASGKPQVSIVDFDSAAASTHELGHSVGNPGKGGNYLVNKGEGEKGLNGESPPDGGESLEWMTPQGIAAFYLFPKTIVAASGNGQLGGGFTPDGCKSIRGGANNNDGRIAWNPNKQDYFYGAPPSAWIQFNDGVPLFGRKVPVNPATNPPLPLTDRGPGIPSDAKPRASGVRTNQPPSAEAPRSGPPSAQHPKKNSLVQNPSPQSQANQILANSTTSTPPSIPEPRLKEPEMLEEPKVPIPPGPKSFGNGGTSKSVVFDESAKKNGTGSSSFFSGSSTSVTFDEGAPKGGGSPILLSGGGGSGEGAVSVGRPSRPAVTVSGKPEAEREPASEEEQKKKKRKQKIKRREFGDGLRNGLVIPLNNIYQSVGTD